MSTNCPHVSPSSPHADGRKPCGGDGAAIGARAARGTPARRDRLSDGERERVTGRAVAGDGGVGDRDRDREGCWRRVSRRWRNVRHPPRLRAAGGAGIFPAGSRVGGGAFPTRRRGARDRRGVSVGSIAPSCLARGAVRAGRVVLCRSFSAVPLLTLLVAHRLSARAEAWLTGR